jgi:Mor family transcriptional regulator
MIDKERKKRGNHPFGSKSGRAKLNESIVDDIWKQHRAGASARSLGRKYKVSKTVILQILHGRTWTHVAHHIVPVEES